MSFLEWLDAQAHRADRVGIFATLVSKDKKFPRTSKLFAILDYLKNRSEVRSLAKTAHREWRKTR